MLLDVNQPAPGGPLSAAELLHYADQAAAEARADADEAWENAVKLENTAKRKAALCDYLRPNKTRRQVACRKPKPPASAPPAELLLGKAFQAQGTLK